MNIGIVGLGLIGGSMAKALKKRTEHTVFGADKVESVLLKARVLDAIDGEMTAENIGEMDMVLIALYPAAAIEFVEENAARFKKGAVVMDLCGVKEIVCEPIRKMAAANGFIYIGGHPMAGKEFSGFTYSTEVLFDGASMILVPFSGTPIELVQDVKNLFLQIGFTYIQISTPEEHDRMIAFTSQLAHVVSGAYIKSPTALYHIGFSAGSYKDMTRVAKLNEEMWTELFMANPKYLCEEIDTLIENLRDYRDAIAAGDRERVYDLLKEGRQRKAVVDGTGEREAS